MQSMFFKIFVTFFFVVLFQPLFASHFFTDPADKFLSIADIHFTPFTDCQMVSAYPCSLVQQLNKAPYQAWDAIFAAHDKHQLSGSMHDTNYALLQSSLEEIKAINEKEKPRFVLILGDFLPHHFREQYILFSHDYTQTGYHRFLKKTLQFLASKLRQAIPTGDIYPVIGNNDSYIGNYGVEPNGEFLEEVKQIWLPFIQDKKNQESFKRHFSTGGYYSMTLPTNPHQRIIVLDTVLFSPMVHGEAVKTAALAELDWLHQELSTAVKEHQQVILALHIPVGIDVYKTVKNFSTKILAFWQPLYSDIFYHDVQEFSEVISAILPGHLHMDSFQMISNGHGGIVPVSFTPSISPIYGNNPGFKVYSYDAETFQLKNYDTYYYPLNEKGNTAHWQKEYSFNQIYQSACSHCDLIKGMTALTPSSALVNDYKTYYAVGNRTQPISQDHYWVPYYWCNIHAITQADYKTCVAH